MNKTVSGHCLTRAKNKAKVQLCNPKSGCGRLPEWSLNMLFITKSQLNQSFAKVVVTRAGRL